MEGFYDPDIYKEDKQYNFYKEEKQKKQALVNYKQGDRIEIKMYPTFEIIYKEDSGFAVYDCCLIDEDSDEEPDTFTLTGQFITHLDIGHSYSVIGIVTDRENETQLTLDKIIKIEPCNKPSIIAFLRTLEGASVFSELIYNEFGKNTLDVIRKTPSKVLGVAPAIYKEMVLN